MTRALLAVLAGFSLTAAAAEPERLVCIARSDRPLLLKEPDCATVTASELRVDQDEKIGSAIVVDPVRGTLLVALRGRSKVPFTLPDLIPVRLAIRSSSSRRVEQIEIEVRAENGPTWKWSVPGKDASSPHFSVPPGRYGVTISAPHHDTLSLPPFDVGPNSPISRKEILKAIPSVRGRLVGIANAPLATILDDNDRVVGSADRSGTFAIDLRDHWPEQLKIAAAGYGVKHIELPPAPQADFDAGAIELAAGGSLRLRRSSAGDPPKATALLLASENLHLVAEKQFERNRDLVFDALEPRQYIVQLRGSGQFERFAKTVDITSGTVQDLTFPIAAQSVHFTVSLGDRRLSRSTVRLKHVDGKWEGSLTTDEKGEAVAEFWQTGQFLASVTSDEVPVPHVQLITISDENVEFRLPDAQIRGVVVENGTQRPIPDVEVGLRTEADGLTTSLRTHTDAKGRFEYRAVKPGHHTLIANAVGFLPSDAIDFELAPDQSGRDVTLVLSRGSSVVLRLYDAAGKPCANAAVAEVNGGRFAGTRFSDESGNSTMTIPEGESRVLVVVPREGSFAVVRVHARQMSDSPEEPMTVIVPAASALLDVKTQSENSEPIANVVLALRYNGTTLPLEIVQVLDRVQGTRFVTAANGVAHLPRIPPGLYEFQPLWSRREADANSVLRARVEVRPGENRAVLTFTAAETSSQLHR